MELIKRNIHMDRIRAEAVSQLTLEDDLNIPENKPDVEALNMEKDISDYQYNMCKKLSV